MPKMWAVLNSGQCYTRGGGAYVQEGSILCTGCAGEYPIVDHVPRFVDSSKYAESFSFQRAQMEKLLDTYYSPERVTSDEMMLQQFIRDELEAITGKFVLDAGCGYGRFAAICASHGAEVVGIDLSTYSIHVCQRKLCIHNNAHFFQADIFDLPFREGTFDLILSIGVLHHTPNCEMSFRKLCRLLKPGGRIAIYIYGKGESPFIDIYRKMTTRIPKRLLYYLCYLAVPIDTLQRIPKLGLLFRLFFPIHSFYSPMTRRQQILGTFDIYSPTYRWTTSPVEVFKWFEEEGFMDIKIGNPYLSATGVKRK